jgi:hypothetical protein
MDAERLHLYWNKKFVITIQNMFPDIQSLYSNIRLRLFASMDNAEYGENFMRFVLTDVLQTVYGR